MNEKTTAASFAAHEPGDLFGRTVRSVAVLVGACILFVATLSVMAVTIASKAMGERKAADVTETEPAAPKKPIVGRPATTGSQSI
ncbi:MAG: hypothetical protein KIS78_35815 [Labilithrix sp.]|nr:hypothetical protein [Labilithrix sp.]MCW5837814.1 hypothetical protein [Labilithrix sp.]